MGYLPSLRSLLRFANADEDVDDVWKLFKCDVSKPFATAAIELWLSRKSPVSAQTEKNRPEWKKKIKLNKKLFAYCECMWSKSFKQIVEIKY